MKKTLLISILALLGAIGFTSAAQAATCADVNYSAELLAENPMIKDACLEVVEKNGIEAIRLHAKVVRQGVTSTTVRWKMPDGSWSSSDRRYPTRGATADIDGQDIKIHDLAPGQEVNVYVPSANNWSLMAATPAAAAAPAPAPAPVAAPAPAPEPMPAALPKTATQLSLFALLGGLLILLGGAVSIVRTRL